MRNAHVDLWQYCTVSAPTAGRILTACFLV